MNRIKGIACSIFKKEIEFLQENGRLDMEFEFIDSRNHVFPENLEQEINQLLTKNRKSLLVFGDCHVHMVDLEKNQNIKRITGMNCIEIYLGTETYKKYRKEGAFFLLPEWAGRWEEVFKEWLGLKEDTAKEFMQEMHKKLIYVDTGVTEIPVKALEEISSYCGLKYDILNINLNNLDLLIKNKITEFANETNYNAARSRAYDFLVVDMIEKIMNYSSSKDCSMIIAENIRELLGVKVVAVFHHIRREKDFKHKLLSMIPARRLDVFKKEDLEQLASEIIMIEDDIILQRINSSEKIIDFLDKYEINKLGLLPLKINDIRIGSIALLDLYDDRNIHVIMESLMRISGIIALVLQNSSLIANLESTIEERTKELRASKEKAELITRTVPSGVYTVDSNRIITSWNAMCENITGYTPEEMIGKPCSKFTLEPCKSRCGIFDDKRSVLGKECSIICKNGDVRYILKNTELLKNDENEIIGAVESFEDITNRKKAEQKLKESEELLSITGDISRIGGWRIDLDKKQVNWSKTTRDIHEVDDDFVPTIENGNNFYYGESKSTITRAFNKLVNEGEEYDLELQIVTAKNNILWVRTIGRMELYSGKKQIYGTIQDITEKKRSEQALEISRERLKTASSILRHDITNDLAVIDSALAIYKEEQIPEMLDEIKNRVDRCVTTIRRQREHEMFLDSYAELEEYHLDKVAQEVADQFEGVEIEIKGKAIAYADKALYSLFQNLISNAIRHGKTDRIEIEFESDEYLSKIRFSDFGSGIPDNIKKKVFKKGFKYGKTGHTGIGLYIVKKTIEDYKGKIKIMDNQPQGTIFEILLNKVMK